MKTGLVLEGGGSRGNYTTGVLDAFMENGIVFDLVVGVSAGACGGVSYVANQPGRGKRVNLEFLNDKRYMSMRNLIREGSYIGMQFTFATVPNEIVYFDYDTFQGCRTEFVAVAAEAETAKPVYFPKTAMKKGDFSILQASSSLPGFSRPTVIDGVPYYDGGVVDPIPVRYALESGCDRIVVVRTQPEGYIKPPQGGAPVYRFALRKYPAIIEALKNRHNVYNETQDFIRGLGKSGGAVILRPSSDLSVGRFDKNEQKLLALYDLGRQDANEKMDELKSFIQ